MAQQKSISTSFATLIGGGARRSCGEAFEKPFQPLACADAISAYVRIGEPYPMMVPLTTCLLAWLGLYLRDERIRALLPFRRGTSR